MTPEQAGPADDAPLTRRELRRLAGGSADEAGGAPPPVTWQPPQAVVPQPWQPPQAVVPQPWQPPQPTAPEPSQGWRPSPEPYQAQPAYPAPGPYGSTPQPYPAPGPYGTTPQPYPAPGPYGSTPQPYQAQPAGTSGPSDAMHWLLPVGRSWQSIVAGYLGLFAWLLWPLAPFSIGLGVWALVLARRGGHGTGRAITGIVGGVIGLALGIAFLVAWS